MPRGKCDITLDVLGMESKALQFHSTAGIAFFYLGFSACQDYFTHFYFTHYFDEPSQSLGGAKMGDPREKPPDHPQAEFGLSNM